MLALGRGGGGVIGDLASHPIFGACSRGGLGRSCDSIPLIV